MIRTILWLLTVGLMLVSVVPHIWTGYWFVDLFSHYKLHYLIAAMLLLAFSFWKARVRLLMIILTGILAFNAIFIVPFYLPAGPTVDPEATTFKLLSFNILSENKRYEEVVNFIESEDPDFIALQEYDVSWHRALQSKLPQYPYRLVLPVAGNFGIATFSKYPAAFRPEYFGLSQVASIVATISTDSKTITLINTHTVPPIGAFDFRSRNQHFQHIVSSHYFDRYNLIVAGDMNSSSFSPHFRPLLQSGDLKDSRLSFGLQHSWPAGRPYMSTTLDHVLISPNIVVSDRRTGPSLGSDHRSVIMEFQIP